MGNIFFPVLRFQLQIQTYVNGAYVYINRNSANEFIKRIDPNSPIPQPLEGGNGLGPLYECILDEAKKDQLLQACNQDTHTIMNSPLYLISGYYRIQLEKSNYRPDYYVHWQFFSDTTVTSDKNDS